MEFSTNKCQLNAGSLLYWDTCSNTFLARYEGCAQFVKYIIDSIYWNAYFIVSRHQHGLTLIPAFSPLALTRPRLQHTERPRKAVCRRPSRHSPKNPSSLEKPLSSFPKRDESVCIKRKTLAASGREYVRKEQGITSYLLYTGPALQFGPNGTPVELPGDVDGRLPFRSC
jgi:hypothetical protein